MQLNEINTVTVIEAAERLGLSADRIYTLCACGVLRAVRAGRRIEVCENSLNFMAEERRRKRMAAKPRHLRLVVNN